LGGKIAGLIDETDNQEVSAIVVYQVISCTNEVF
jgi:hypothetical protein